MSSMRLQLQNRALCSNARIQTKSLQAQTFRVSNCVNKLGFRSSSYLSPLIITQTGFVSSRRQASRGAQPVQASFLGVGAPEAILVGVVALVLFGPKGLAQAAKSLGATLRAFAPTLREITAVSAELKSTLEDEIGINEIRNEFSRPAVPRPLSSSSSQDDELSELASTMTADDVDPDIERKRAESAKMAWGEASPAAAQDDGASIQNLSLEQLEAELQRRKAAAAGNDVPPQL